MTAYSIDLKPCVAEEAVLVIFQSSEGAIIPIVFEDYLERVRIVLMFSCDLKSANC